MKKNYDEREIKRKRKEALLWDEAEGKEMKLETQGGTGDRGTQQKRKMGLPSNEKRREREEKGGTYALHMGDK